MELKKKLFCYCYESYNRLKIKRLLVKPVMTSVIFKSSLL